MFTKISWTNYIAVCALLLVAYYVIIGLKYYSSKLISFFSGKRKSHSRLSSLEPVLNSSEEINTPSQQNQAELFTSHKKYAPFAEETDDTFQQVEELTVQLKEVIAEAVSKDYVKEEFILSLQLLLKKYRFLKGSLFPGAINDLIASECKKYGYIHLSAEERVTLWNE